MKTLNSLCDVTVTNKKYSKLNQLLYKNKCVLRDSERLCLARKNYVNLNAWINPEKPHQNVGDYLSAIVLEKMCDMYGIDRFKSVSKTKHLYAVGSILLGFQDCTVWGSGFGYDRSTSKLWRFNSILHKYTHKIDIRAVRGPETKRLLNSMGIECPEKYGDPAVLMPMFYNKTFEDKKEYIVIPHYSRFDKFKECSNVVSTYTKNYEDYIDSILQAEFVISSSLHGIILAEAYGIPAIMLKDTPCSDITKYKDWYASTGRKDFVVAESVEEALSMKREILDPDIIAQMQQTLIDTFPKDLFD